MPNDPRIEIQKALEVTKGQEWDNFDGHVDSANVYEIDRITEEHCNVIAECETVELAHFIANAPEWLRYLLTLVEQQQGEIERLINERDYWQGYGEESIRIEEQLRDQLQKEQKENERLRGELEQVVESVKCAHLSLTWCNTEYQVPHAVWHLDSILSRYTEKGDSPDDQIRD
ncbi:hypothetical protein [Cohnella sp. AR92]|uniref:hypothetical protein n=1 Tax=Cohnella sp. AR92 TaxID=648716 RepID=UPI000F8EEE7B|nr:hypothetical protein [Cohnella sp. AR92]RUS47550.1 hypothetical protein ELR57_07060 [Cohnella sp. AR92]